MLAVVLTLLVAEATPSPTASPAPTPTSACSHDADVVKPVPPYATISLGTPPLYATVEVLVAPDGSVKKAHIYKTSGDLLFDQASVWAAKRSTYKPKVVDCNPVEGTYFFKTSLTQGPPPP